MNKWCATLSAVIVLACSLLVYRYVEDTSIEKQIGARGQLTLLDALYVGMFAAKKWNPDAVPLYLTSVDDDLGEASGQEGTRDRWNLQVGAPGVQRAVVAIRYGKVERIITGVGPYRPEYIVAADRVKIDSTTVADQSKRASNLKPGRGWANGYHFILQAVEGVPMITIVGRDEHNQLRQIDFDAGTGRILSE
ncbi:hypothetical protein [Paenibacillus alvei]|uniref:hypothetical protein n=1 Tax=Paenibacillus alvei TaxID=44250 RepID=UPI0013DBF7BD|nr:hypothetical protein [Paenibacillus alvei]NEZ41221.1 hypothetical protein [Paenibacillus alvei]